MERLKRKENIIIDNCWKNKIILPYISTINASQKSIRVECDGRRFVITRVDE